MRIQSALAVLCLGAGAIFLAVSLLSYANDDPYITYRYARNLAQGNGIVYNLGLNVLSTTTPLYMSILALAYLVGPDLPALSNIFSALSLGLAVILLHRMAAARGESLAGFIGGLLTLFFPIVLFTLGAETTLHIFLILASFYLYSQKRLSLAAVTAGLATLTRGDGVLVAAAMAIHFIWTERKLPLRPFLLYSIVIAPWYTYCWLHFGSPFPITLRAKLYQSEMMSTEGFFEGIAHTAGAYADHAGKLISCLYLLLMLVGAVALVRKHRWAVPLMLWAVLYLIGYSVLDVPRYSWYYGPLIPPLMLLAGLGASELGKGLFASPRLQAVVGLALAALLILPNLAKCADLISDSPDGRAQIYTEAGNWLRQHTPADATVGTLEVGILGYFSERSIVDFSGLIQPDVAEHVKAGFENAAVWAIGTYSPDYLVFHPGWFPTMVAAPWFSGRYRVIERFENERYVANPLVVYAATRRPE